MNKKSFKLLSLALTLVLMFSCVTISVSAQEMPVGYYELDSVSFKTEKYAFSNPAPDADDIEQEFDEIVDDWRDSMTDREEVCDIRFTSKKLYSGDELNDCLLSLFSAAFAETNESDEGDYIRYLCTGYNPLDAQLWMRGKDYLYEISLQMGYYTNKAQEDAVEDKIDDIIDGFDFNKKTTQKQKSDAIYRYITENVEYDYDNLYDENHKLKFTAYAALIDGKAVCQGYASLYYRMAKECGLNVRIISGESFNQGHAWNIVKIDGDFYYLDSTWDAGKRPDEFKYYLKGSNDFEDHKLDEEFLTREFASKYPISKTNYFNILDDDCSDGHNYKIADENTDVIKYVCDTCGDDITKARNNKGETLAEDLDGELYYFVDGIKNNSTTLIERDGELYYVKGGKWAKNTDALVNSNGKYYYIQNGKWQTKTTKLLSFSGQMRFIKQGIWNNSFTGFEKYNNSYYYIKNGIWNKTTTLVKSGSKLYHVKNGIKSTATDFVKYGASYYYIKNGEWAKETGFIKYGSKYYYVSNGIRSSATGFVKSGGKYYQIKNGVRSSTATFEKCGNAYLRISATEYTYNGKAKKPSVKIYDSKGKTLSSKYYTITYDKGRKNVGKYKVTVKFKGKYSGTKKFYFTINPDDTSISKVTALKTSLKVTLKKKSKQVTGYQIQYSTSKSFKSAKTKTTKSTSYTIKSLKAKKTYYVRVRTYKTVGGKKYYSEWSKVKSKKTK